jgi:hypothetical protein
MEQKPSIGRIVIYNHPGSADGRFPPAKSPAIIRAVGRDGNPGEVDMEPETVIRAWVFGETGIHQTGWITQGDGPCQWNWPPRV